MCIRDRIYFIDLSFLESEGGVVKICQKAKINKINLTYKYDIKTNFFILITETIVLFSILYQ